ncbi:MAG: hypothetical protein K5761_05125 [Clostridiales bacterium]|nr:hypothetical protein [Clostridiales bacterium]
MGKTYFVDSENVGDSWISLLDTVADDDEIIVFFTDKSPYMNYNNVVILTDYSSNNPKKKPTFIKCCEGSNALDFQLSTELGFRVHDINDGEYIIFANDNGYEAVINYWKKRGITIQHLRPNANSQMSSTVPLTPNNTVVAPKQLENTKPELDSGSVPSSALEILYILGRDNLQNLHLALQQLYGTKKGKNYYNAFKTSPSYNNFLAGHKAMNKKEKQKEYCSIVFKLDTSNIQMPKDFSVFVMKSWSKKKNLNSLRASLQGKYGKDMSEKYYSIIKKHVKIMDKIK